MKIRDLAVLITCSAVFILLIMPIRGTVTDDTYIHLQYARNLAETGELSFNRGDPTYGATSPLWVFILAAVYRLGGDILVWSWVLSWGFGLASVFLAYRFVLLLDGRTATATAAALIMASEAWLLRWSAVGMESSFASFMVFLVLYVSMTATRSAARSVLFGLTLFLAFLGRPEALLLAPLALLVLLPARGVSFRNRVLWLVVYVPLLAVWLTVIKTHTGTFFPLTAGAKQGSIILSPAVFMRALVPIKIIGATMLIPSVLLFASLLLGLFRERSLLGILCGNGGPAAGSRHARSGMALILLWIFALPAVYIIFDFQIISRYLLPVLPAILVLGTRSFTGVTAAIQWGKRAKNTMLVVFTGIVVLQSVIFYSVVVITPTRELSNGVRNVLVPMAEWLESNSDGEALVAAPDIGALGYVSKRRILDLGGLVTPEINRMRSSMDIERIITEGLFLKFGPDYLVDRSTELARFESAVIRGVRYEEVMRGRVERLGIRKPQPVTYVLYRLLPAGSSRIP